MRLKHIKNADVIISNSEYLIQNPLDYKSKYQSLFNNGNDIEIEIGCGKGKFILSKALANPNINYIAIEKYDTPLVSLVKKLDSIDKINNLRIMCVDAMNIDSIFDKEISKVYLNFSDPWPKKRHAKRRLTSSVFLEKYDKIFKNEKRIEMKTDNDDLYEYSLTSLTDYGYDVIETNTNYFDTFTTEYEDKFISLGKNINYINVVKK